jgi:hypothetical protein
VLIERNPGVIKLKPGTTKKMIDAALKKYKVSKKIFWKTILSRYVRKKLKCNHRGTETPMAPLEPVILERSIQKVLMNQPFTVTEGLHLCNSLIKKGSSVERGVISYQKRRGQFTLNGSSTRNPGCLLGTGYWYRFRKRYEHKLVFRRGVQFGHNRSEWCKYDNFHNMYEPIYAAMEFAGVASKLEVPEWQNEFGEPVRSKSEAVGEKVEYTITHSGHILYVDEVGNNTNQRDDGHKGGQKYVLARGSHRRTGCSTSDAHWTTIGFVAGNGTLMTMDQGFKCLFCPT